MMTVRQCFLPLLMPLLLIPWTRLHAEEQAMLGATGIGDKLKTMMIVVAPADRYALESGFRQSPASARPHSFRTWMNGNVTALNALEYPGTALGKAERSVAGGSAVLANAVIRGEWKTDTGRVTSLTLENKHTGQLLTADAGHLPRNPGPYHFGDFADPVNLRLYPEFEKYMKEAFKPLGVYLKFWGDGEPGKELTRTPWFPINGGAERKFEVVLVNDDQEPVTGKLVLSVEAEDGKILASAERQFSLEAVGRNAYELSVPVPKESGRYLLNATAHPEGARHKGITVSRRKIAVGK